MWLLTVGRVSLVLLDTDLPDNATDGPHHHRSPLRRRPEASDRAGAGPRGRRGPSAAAPWAASPSVYHLNEGHAGFLLLELLDREIARPARRSDEARRRFARTCVFTTHTPVPAGIDRFPDATWPPLSAALGRRLAGAGGRPHRRWAPTRRRRRRRRSTWRSSASNRPRAANGVSQASRLGQSRAVLLRCRSGAAIGSITNGVHARTWAAPHLQAALRRSRRPVLGRRGCRGLGAGRLLARRGRRRPAAGRRLGPDRLRPRPASASTSTPTH